MQLEGNAMTAVSLTTLPKTITRSATKDDAVLMARLIEIAGAGIPSFLWSTMAEIGETPLDVGARRARRENGSFSYTNAIVATVDNDPVGMMLGFPLNAPTAADLAALNDIPALFKPLVALEYEVPGSFYINALAVLLGRRNRGLGGLLIEASAKRARQLGCSYLSVQAFSQNPGAVRLYQRHGFSVIDERPIIAHPCYPYDDRTLLMTRELDCQT